MVILVTGGAFQGKTTYIREQLWKNSMELVEGEDWEPDRVSHPFAVNHLEHFIRRQLAEGKSQEEILERLLQAAQGQEDVIWEIREIGCGIVPMEKEERRWREVTGRIGCKLAGRADQVYRVISGIGVRIKG